METLKDVALKIILAIALMPLVIGVVAGGYLLMAAAGAFVAIAIILKSLYNILFK